MSRRLTGLLCLITVVCGGVAGCASGFGLERSKPFRKGEQKEPFVEVDDEEKEEHLENWQKETAQMRGQSKRKPGRDGWLDSLMWSSESQDIARSLNADL